MRLLPSLLTLLAGALAVGVFLYMLRPDEEVDPRVSEAAVAPGASPAAAAGDASLETSPATDSPPRGLSSPAELSEKARRAAVDRSESAWIVEGRAHLGFNVPYPNARVVVRLYDGLEVGESARLEEELQCDDEGRYRWPLPAPSGPVTLTVSAVPTPEGEDPEHHAFSAEQTVAAGADPPRDLDITFLASDVWVVGTVRDEEGRPLAGASVRAAAEALVTADDGSYRLPSTSMREQEYVSAQAAGYTKERGVVQTAGASGEVNYDFKLRVAVQARGRVVDVDGRPVQGARVTTFYSAGEFAESDAEGRYVLDHLDPIREQHSLYARKDGYVEGSLNVTTDELRTEELELVLTRGTRIDGRVLGPDGKALEGVELYIGFSPFAYNRLDASTDADGYFVFPNVGSGTQTLVAQYSGLAPSTQQLLVPEDEDALPTLRIDLQEGHYVAGVVTDESGEPLEGIWVSGQEHGEYIETRAESDSEGRFRLEGLPAEGVSIELYMTGFVRQELPVEVLDRDDLQVILVRAGGTGGRVVDGATGEPIDELTVRFTEPQLQAGDARLHGYSARWSREGVRFGGTDGYWDTGSANLQMGQVIGIEVSSEGYAPTTVERVIIESKQDRYPHTVALERGGTVVGVVLDAQRVPVPGSTVRVRPEGAGYGRSYGLEYELGITRTGEDGRFHLDNVSAGPSDLWVTAPGRSAIREGPFEVFAGTTIERTIVLSRPGRLGGRVFDSDGQPERGVKVEAQIQGPGSMSAASLVALSAHDGSFAFEDLSAGLYQVSRMLEVDDVEVHAHAEFCRVEAGETARVELGPEGGGRIRGSVECEALGLLAAFEVKLRGSGEVNGGTPGFEPSGLPRSTRSAVVRDGAFELDGLAPGSYTLSVHHFTGGGFIKGTTDVVVSEGTTTDARLTLELQRR